MSEVNPVNPLQVLGVNPVNPLDRQRLIRSIRFGQSVSLVNPVNPVTTSEVNPVNPLQAGFGICHDICLSFLPAPTCIRMQVGAAASG